MDTMSFLSQKTVLVTGGTGSIGSEIVRQVLESDARKVIVFSRDEIKHFLLKKRVPDYRLETVIGDTRNKDSLRRVFEKYDVDIIFHAAAMKHVVICEESPIEAVETNIIGTQNLVDLALKNNVSRMITISTDKAAYPTSVMGATKFIAEKITLNGNKATTKNQKFSCVRFGNVAGSRGSVIPVYIEDLLNGRPLMISDPAVTRFIMEIPDAVRLVIKAAEYAQGGEIFILKMKAFKLGDLVDILVNRIAPKLNIQDNNISIHFIGLVPGEKLHEDLINASESSRLYETDDLYLILPDHPDIQRYTGLARAGLARYRSDEVDLLSPEELENLIIRYLKHNNMLEAQRKILSDVG
ncbi:MAG: polysaccharide biosynthesis protein [Dehalococcoidales bacterium]|jgi:FlaA1/EpsC-like NDP-sugar epimerase|nr:polysaccharide biosynthesis protein [Dehalococcoidales bacterium]